MSFKQLRKFSDNELLFDEKETRVILKFIFEPADFDFIESLTMSDSIRGFTQGLLVEAIDASYAIGFVDAIFRSTTNPTKGALAIIKEFSKKALKHWFKHATVNDLQKVKVYDFVRLHIANQFRKPLRVLVYTASKETAQGAFLVYKQPANGLPKVWV
jgi:hypothetical protein